jgi:cyclic AMP-dependent transcription factor ATF-4
MSEDESSMLSDEKMLDALLVGNLDEAVTFMPGVLQIPLYASEDSIKVQPKEQRKPTKGGRKATNQRRKKTPKIEKIIRKKEQNKTAALRYRMKKKVEVEVTLEREAELQADHDNLMKEKNELAKEIQMVKQLLKAVFSNRKSKLQTLKKF